MSVVNKFEINGQEVLIDDSKLTELEQEVTDLLLRQGSYLGYINRKDLTLINEYSVSLVSYSGNFVNIVHNNERIPVTINEEFSLLYNFKEAESSSEIFYIRVYEYDELNQIGSRIDYSVSDGLFVYKVSDPTVSSIGIALFSDNNNTGATTGFLSGYLYKGRILINDLITSELTNRLGVINAIIGRIPIAYKQGEILASIDSSLMSDEIDVTESTRYVVIVNVDDTQDEGAFAGWIELYDSDGNVVREYYTRIKEFYVDNSIVKKIRVGVSSTRDSGGYSCKASIYLYQDYTTLQDTSNIYKSLLYNSIRIPLRYLDWNLRNYVGRRRQKIDTDLRRACIDYIPVNKGDIYIIEGCTKAKWSLFLYDVNLDYQHDLTSGWFTETNPTVVIPNDGWIGVSMQTVDDTPMTYIFAKEVDGYIYKKPYNQEIEKLTENVEKNIAETAINTNNIISLSTRISALEGQSVIVSDYPDVELSLRTKIRNERVFSRPVFAVCTDNHCSPASNPYVSSVPVETIYNHADITAKMCNTMGVDWVANLGDIVSGERYSVVQDVLNDMDRYTTLLRQAKAPLLYSIAHHELYFDGVQGYEVGATRQQIWSISGNTGTYIDYMKHYGSEIYSDISASMYYYFDNPVTRLRVINLCTVDGGSIKVGYNQLVWIRDYALKDVPEGYGVIVIGHATISAKLMGYDGTTYGLSMYDEKYDKDVDELTIDSILNDAIDNGVNVLAYLSGHAHRDNVWTLNGSKYPNIITNSDFPYNGSNTQEGALGIPERYDRSVDTLSEYCIDFYVIDTQDCVCRIFRFGCGYDRVVYCRNRNVGVNETLDLTSIIGTTLYYTSLDNNIATITNGIVSGVSEGQTQIIAYDSESNTKHYITIIVS